MDAELGSAGDHLLKSPTLVQIPSWCVLAVFCGVLLFSVSVESVVMPVLPVHFRQLQIPQVWSGALISCYPVASLTAALFVAKLIAYGGRLQVLVCGLLLQGAAVALFGFADEITGGAGADVSTALIVYACSRLSGGLGGACVDNVSYSIAADRFPNHVGKLVGLGEVLVGVGFSAGPLLGNAIFMRFGFTATFLVCGSTVLAFVPFALLLLQPWAPLAAPCPSHAKGSLVHLATPGLLAAGCCACFGGALQGMIFSTLSLHLIEDVGTGQEVVGWFFVVFNVAYCIAGIAAGALADRWQPLRLCLLGSLTVGLVLSVWGLTAPLLPRSTPARLGYECGMLAALSLGQATMVVPCLAAMRASVRGGEGSTELVVAWLNVFFQLGVVVGPLLGTAVREGFGFGVMVTALGAVQTIFGIACLSLLRTGQPQLADEAETSYGSVTRS